MLNWATNTMNLLAFFDHKAFKKFAVRPFKMKPRYLMKILLALVSCLLISCKQSTNYEFPHSMDHRWIVINYWAAWCTPCRHEIPELNKLTKNHSKNIIVYGINFDEQQGEALQNDIKKLNIQFKQLSPAYMTQFEALNISTIPATLIINPNGELVEQLTGVQTEVDILNWIQQHQ